VNEAQELLSQLRGVQAPPVSAIPAYGWWLLTALLIGFIYLAYRNYRRYVAHQWQREARLELERLRALVNESPVAQTLADTSRLARRVLLVVQSREEVASLHGDAWLEMLDRVCGKPLFSGGFGRLREKGPYQREPSVSSDDLDALFDAMDELIASAQQYRGPGA